MIQLALNYGPIVFNLHSNFNNLTTWQHFMLRKYPIYGIKTRGRTTAIHYKPINYVCLMIYCNSVTTLPQESMELAVSLCVSTEVGIRRTNDASYTIV